MFKAMEQKTCENVSLVNKLIRLYPTSDGGVGHDHDEMRYQKIPTFANILKYYYI